jgi:hypothetical protein
LHCGRDYLRHGCGSVALVRAKKFVFAAEIVSDEVIVAGAYPRSSTLLFLSAVIFAFSLWLGNLAQGQVYYPDQEVRIGDLPSLTAKSRSGSDVLAASVEIILNDREICCGKDSALEDSIQTADPRSLQNIATRLKGRHVLSDGRSITVTAEYWSASSINSGPLIGTLNGKRALLMEWKSHLYVAYGVIFDQTVSQDGGVMNAIHKILLLDPRFSDDRRAISFDRLTDDWGKVQGMLLLKVEPQ